MSLDLIIRYETTGLDTIQEHLDLADFVYGAGLHRSTGSWGRFLNDMWAAGWRPADAHGNRLAVEGVTRCHCGCKYWEHDRCTDCGTQADDDLVKGDD